MFYFVSSWYDNKRPWYQEAPEWFHVFDQMTFDDTVNHLKMCHQAKEDAALLVLNYQPQLRYFLHKQDLLDTSYWSFFDDIQGISLSYTAKIDFKQLAWPRGTVFTYSAFMVLAHRSGQLLAEIAFGENGNLLTIQWFEENQKSKRYVFDDRGFLSSILYFEAGVASYQDYLNPRGVWQVREDLAHSGQLRINPEADKAYKQRVYASWEDLLTERLEVFKQTYLSNRDCLMIASHRQHNNVLITTFAEQQKVFSFFGHRFECSDTTGLRELAQAANLIVTADTRLERQLVASLEQLALPLPKMTRISPFDTRLRLGRSQTIKDLVICCFIDGLNEDDYQTVVTLLLDAMAANPLIRLNLLTYQQGFAVDQTSHALMEKIKADYDVKRFMAVDKTNGENQLDDEGSLRLSAISVKVLTNETQLISVLDTARLVLDLGSAPDVYTQIASLSAGVPQVNRVSSEYVTHGENGWILEELSDLPEVLTYYFDGLTNWNKSLVHTVQKMGDYTSGRLIRQLKHLLEE